MVSRVLFVCTGNTCRSPMAQVLAERAAADLGLSGIEIRSAGAAALPGMPASGGAIRTAARSGLDLSTHMSASLTPELVEWADLILVMSLSHLAAVRSMGSDGKEAFLAAYAEDREGEPGVWGVPDPVGGSDEVYEETFIALGQMVRKVFQRLQREEV